MLGKMETYLLHAYRVVPFQRLPSRGCHVQSSRLALLPWLKVQLRLNICTPTMGNERGNQCRKPPAGQPFVG